MWEVKRGKKKNEKKNRAKKGNEERTRTFAKKLVLPEMDAMDLKVFTIIRMVHKFLVVVYYY